MSHGRFATTLVLAALLVPAAAGSVLLPHIKSSSVVLGGSGTLSDVESRDALAPRCETGDYVCELIEMHTSGLLTNHRLINLTEQLDNTWQRSMTLGVNVNMLSERVQSAVDNTADLRGDVSFPDRVLSLTDSLLCTCPNII